MKIFKATNTLDSYLPPLNYTDDKSTAEIMLVGGKKFTLSDFPNLKGIFKTGVGTDNLPFDEAALRNVSITLPSEATCNIIYEETAAFTCHLIMCGLYSQSGHWDTWTKLDRSALQNQQLLVVGNGRIGKRVTAKMKNFMVVETFDTLQDSSESFEQKVRRANCVTLHIPLTPETESLFNAERLAWLQDDALLVNTSRGPVVHEGALYAELKTGRLRAACDVFWDEPYSGILAKLPCDRFIKTPHIASTCREFTRGATEDFLKFLDGATKTFSKRSES